MAGLLPSCVQVPAELHRTRTHQPGACARAPVGRVLQGAPGVAPCWQPVWAGRGVKWEFVINRPGCQQCWGAPHSLCLKAQALASLRCLVAAQPGPGPPSSPTTLPNCRAAGIPAGGFLSLRAITLGCWHSTQVMARLPELPQGPPGCHGAVEPWLQGCVSAPTPCMVTCLVL